jgi:hypothetical protein
MFRTFMLRRSRILSLTGAIVLTASLAVIAAGCGGSDSGVAQASGGGSTQASSTTATTASTSGSRDEKMLAFAKCMRTDGGVPDFPDPTADENGDLQLAPPAGGGNNNNNNQQDIRGGFEKCQKYLDGVISPPSQADQTEIRDAQLEFAKCMRTEGVDVPDPDPNQQGPGGFADIDRNDPKVQAAMKKCAPIFQDALGGRGPGGAPGGGAAGGA